MFFPALWVNCFSQMGILEPDSQTKQSTTTHSLMCPCDMCFSPGALITHLEAIWDENHHRRRRHQGSASTAATGSSDEQPPIVSSLPLPCYGTLAGSSLTWFYSITPGTRGGVERPGRERWRRRRRREGGRVKGRRRCQGTGGRGPREADQIGALKISHVGALWRPNGWCRKPQSRFDSPAEGSLLRVSSLSARLLAFVCSSFPATSR